MPALGQHRQENSMVEVVRIENRPLGSLEDKLVGDVVLALKVPESLANVFRHAIFAVDNF